MRVLLVEDQQKVADALREGLTSEGFAVVHEPTGDEGFSRAATDSFDLILLDLGLPGRDGLDILKTLRRQRRRLHRRRRTGLAAAFHKACFSRGS